MEQHAGEGLSVWIGIDGNAAAIGPKAAAVLAELQRVLPLAGQRLSRVVCNGIAIHTEPYFDKETS